MIKIVTNKSSKDNPMSQNLPFSIARSIKGTRTFFSGQVGLKEGQLVADDIEEQTKQIVANLKEALLKEYLSLDDVVDVTAYLTKQEDYESFNKVYAELFKPPYPTRTTIGVAWLPLNARVELKVIAVKKE